MLSARAVRGRGSMQLSTEVAIVGGGPVGLVLALYLDFYGIKSTLLNTETESRWHPKGNGQNARTMEHYRRLGAPMKSAASVYPATTRLIRHISRA